MAKKKIRITADNYKLDRFKQELNKKGFTDFKISPLGRNDSSPVRDISLIKVEVNESDIETIGTICIEVEDHFKKEKK